MKIGCVDIKIGVVNIKYIKIGVVDIKIGAYRV